MSLTMEQHGAFLKPNAVFLALASANAYGNGSGVTKWATENYYTVRSFDLQDTQCFLAEGSGDWFLAFRGTDSHRWADWLTDARVARKICAAGGAVHRGFSDALDVVWPQLIELLNKQPQKPLWITGHSLGGALAVLAASRLPERTFGLYTYGQPRVGDASFAAACQARFGTRYFRFVHNRDIVPRVAPFTSGYRHFGNELYANAGKPFLLANSGVETTFDALRLTLGAGLFGGVRPFLETLADHDIKLYCGACER